MINKPEIKELEAFYVASKKKFDTDKEFMAQAHENTVKLQKWDPDCRDAWKFICEVSRIEFEKIY